MNLKGKFLCFFLLCSEAQLTPESVSKTKQKMRDGCLFFNAILTNLGKKCRRFIAGDIKHCLYLFWFDSLRIDPTNDFVFASFLPEVSKVKESC
jgi:hypothetical protein